MSTSPNLKIFISYASEDEDFAKPLADALSSDFEVWFAPYKLTLGDSLLRKLSEGLQSCNYGVVILSPHFFSKEWPQHELDGLFALEATQQKVILPIWKDIDKAEVARYSPILAGRLAGQAKRGIEAVVDEIKIAVGAATTQATFSGAAQLDARLLKLGDQQLHRRRADVLSRSVEGSNIVRDAADNIFNGIKKSLSLAQENAPAMQFYFTADRKFLGVVTSLATVRLNLRFAGDALNSVSEARMDVLIFEPGDTDFDEPAIKTNLFQTKYKPLFASDDSVIWRSEDGKTLSALELQTELLNRFIDEIEGSPE